MLRTTLAGSLPKPSWLADPDHQLFAPWVPPAERLEEAQDDAVRLALHDQEDAGLDIVSDGEQRRRHYIWGFLDGLSGTDTQRLGRKRTRGGKYVAEQEVARIVGEVTWRGPVMGPALAFTKAGSAHSDLTGKVHSGAEAQSLLETEAKNKTLSFVGFAAGLVSAGIATALFAF